MNDGLEKILSCIEADAEAALAALKEAHAQTLADIAAKCDEKVTNTMDAAKKIAASETACARERASSKAEAQTRGILASSKSELVRRAFATAAERFTTMGQDEYLSYMAPLLQNAAAEFGDTKPTLTVPKQHPVSADALLKAAGVTVGKVVEGDLRAGFVLSSDEIEVDCDPEKLIMERYEELAPSVAEALFSAKA